MESNVLKQINDQCPYGQTVKMQSVLHMYHKAPLNVQSEYIWLMVYHSTNIYCEHTLYRVRDAKEDKEERCLHPMNSWYRGEEKKVHVKRRIIS
jgi:hypothetical protein